MTQSSTSICIKRVPKVRQSMLKIQTNHHILCLLLLLNFHNCSSQLRMATQKIDFHEIQSDVRKVFASNYYNFFALSVIFSYPFVLLLIAFPVLQHLQIINIHIPQSPSKQDSINLKHVILLLYTFILLTLYTCASSTITYSSYHVIFGRPVKYKYAIKSICKSCIRLLATFFCALIIIFAGLLAIPSIFFGVIKGFEYLGFQIKYSSKYSVVLKFMLGFGLLYLCVNWVLTPVIVVVEKSWGLEPLKRSTYLVKGGRRVVVRLMLYFCFFMGINFYGSLNSANLDGILKIVTLIFCPLGCVACLLDGFTANTVLYTKCKALQGELTEEIKEEYVGLPLDEEEVPLFASADQPKIYEV